MVYSAIFVKLHRLHRIFQVKLKSTGSKYRRKSMKPFQPAYVDVYSTLWITAGLICVQVFISIVLIVYDPPNPSPVYPERNNDNLKKCSYQASTFFISHLYPSGLIFVSTFYAIKTRKLPENFNETKAIGFAMYSTCIMWLLSIPLYFGVRYEQNHTKAHLYAIVVTMSGFIILACIFIPKTYIILLKPHKNKEEQPVRMTGIRQKPSIVQFSKQDDVIESPIQNVNDHKLCSKCKSEI